MPPIPDRARLLPKRNRRRRPRWLAASRGIGYGLAGENLARNNYPDAQTLDIAFDGLMASPTHQANILEPRFVFVGAAVARARDGMWVYVAIFKD